MLSRWSLKGERAEPGRQPINRARTTGQFNHLVRGGLYRRLQRDPAVNVDVHLLVRLAAGAVQELHNRPFHPGPGLLDQNASDRAKIVLSDAIVKQVNVLVPLGEKGIAGTGFTALCEPPV